jgi:hypothetical protein
MRLREWTLVSAAVVVLAGQSLARTPGRPTIIYAGGEPWPGQTMARIEARAPGSGGHALQVLRAVGPSSGKPRLGGCGEPSYAIGADADLVELHVGTYALIAKVTLLMPPWSVEAHGEVTVESGRCYQPVLMCEGQDVEGGGCRLALKRERCGPLRSARRIVLRPPIPC